MMQHTRLSHQFVQFLPERLEPGALYISMEFATAAHLCCCGCGEQVVTPLTPTDWKMTFDGETVSLWPSIGNWNSACRSHYVIERSCILEAKPWPTRRIESARRADHENKARFFQPEEISDDSPTTASEPHDGFIGWWRRIAGKSSRKK